MTDEPERGYGRMQHALAYLRERLGANATVCRFVPRSEPAEVRLVDGTLCRLWDFVGDGMLLVYVERAVNWPEGPLVSHVPIPDTLTRAELDEAVGMIEEAQRLALDPANAARFGLTTSKAPA